MNELRTEELRHLGHLNGRLFSIQHGSREVALRNWIACSHIVTIRFVMTGLIVASIWVRAYFNVRIFNLWFYRLALEIFGPGKRLTTAFNALDFRIHKL
jgi:hypothetical protein